MMMAIVPWLHGAYAANCPKGTQVVHVIGDVPGAISYDIFSHLHPMIVGNLARLNHAQQVKLLPDNTLACEVLDDGVDDPRAVLLSIPNGPMNYWVTNREVRRSD